jgi:hypothetical protein
VHANAREGSDFEGRARMNVVTRALRVMRVGFLGCHQSLVEAVVAQRGRNRRSETCLFSLDKTLHPLRRLESNGTFRGIAC